jgi:hypothetical protein
MFDHDEDDPGIRALEAREFIERTVCQVRLRELRDKWLPGDDPDGSVWKALINFVLVLRQQGEPEEVGEAKPESEPDPTPAVSLENWSFDEWLDEVGRAAEDQRRQEERGRQWAQLEIPFEDAPPDHPPESGEDLTEDW